MHYKDHGQDWTCSVTEQKTEFPAITNNHRPHPRAQNQTFFPKNLFQFISLPNT